MIPNLLSVTQGWHVIGEPILLPQDFGRMIEDYLPYIARITAIAKYSRRITLQASLSDKGRNYLKWLENVSLFKYHAFMKCAK